MPIRAAKSTSARFGFAQLTVQVEQEDSAKELELTAELIITEKNQIISSISNFIYDNY